jgi:hypothetical protein
MNRALTALLAVSLAGCTAQLPGSFRYQQKVQVFSSSKEVNTSIDLLWVVDNSASMDVNQKKLRDGFATFAREYLKPNWDIRLAVITTDTYLANPAFQNYLNTTIPGTVNYRSSYIASRSTTFVNPASNPTLWNASTQRFTNGVRYGDLSPAWGSSWARLLPGLHDGPMTTLCAEFLPYFLRGTSLCSVRDQISSAQAVAAGVQPCVNPNASTGESSVTSCVNTTQNDVIHSGTPIVETQPPAGVAGDDAWINALVEKFLVNASVGSSGQGSERGIGSLLQLLGDNESTETKFFRPGSLRGIIFMSDEEDQTMDLLGAPAGLNPQTYYQCDQARLAELNPGDARVTTQCPTATNRCPDKVVDGFRYRVSYCPAETAPLLAVSSAKSTIDQFFRTLDGSAGDASPNYFIASIVPTDAAAIQQLQASREQEDSSVGTLKNWAVDRGDRYIEFANQVGNGSLALNIAESDYRPILETIGRVIVSKKATFTLDREPSSLEDLLLWIEHQDGSRTQLSTEQFAIEGTTLRIIDLDLVLQLSSSDRVVIDYQPKNL